MAFEVLVLSVFFVSGGKGMPFFCFVAGGNPFLCCCFCLFVRGEIPRVFVSA